ncbi:MAG: AMP-binding protein [Rikenellaceae bacterium]
MFELLVKNYNKKAIFIGDRSITYTDLLQYSQLYANYYTASCPTKVERIMLVSKNSPEAIIALYATFRIGAITIPVDVQSTAKELAYMINDSRPQLIYAMAENRDAVEECVALVGDAEYKPHIFTCDDIDAAGVGELEPTTIMPGAADDVMTIIYTSGTTGSPKGVMLTYANLWYNVDAVANFANIFNEESRVLLLLPIHHILPYAGAILAPLYRGGQIYIVETLTPESILSTLQRGKITIMIGVPRLYETFAKGIMTKINGNIVAKMLYGLCTLIGSEALSKKIFKTAHDMFGGEMKFFVSGGAALPIETGNIFKNLGFYVLEGYGMTECAPMISFTRPGERKVGYCGRMLPGCEYKIEESGEICVRGSNVMKGYYNREEETAQVMREGWLHTGDTAIYDDRYGIQITGRIKEIIVTPNGKNINPASIENEITQSSSAIKEIGVLLHDDILQAIVYPDLAAVRADTQSTMEEAIRAEVEAYNKEAAGYKRIMRYQVSSRELPKTRLGKIQRFKLSQMIGEREEVRREDVSDRSEVFKLLKAFVDEQTGEYANGDSHFEIDLALDSLGRVSLISYIEESFGVVVTETQLSELSTLNLLSAYVEENSSSTTLQEGDVSWSEILRSGKGDVKLPKSGFLGWLVHTKLWLIFNIFYRFHSKGRENIPNAPVLFVGNHRSGLDGAFVTTPMSWRNVHNTFFFAKDKHFQGGFKQFMAKHNNIILMNVHTNVKESMQQMCEVLLRGNNIVIFPEGTRKKGGDMGDFKESFAILSQTLDIGVVPVAIRGAENARMGALPLPRMWNKIEVEYLPMMRSNPGESAQDFARRVQGTIADALDK